MVEGFVLGQESVQPQLHAFRGKEAGLAKLPRH